MKLGRNYKLELQEQIRVHSIASYIESS